METKRVATLTLDDGRSVELPILEGTLGPDVIDIRSLGQTGRVYLRPRVLFHVELHLQ